MYSTVLYVHLQPDFIAYGDGDGSAIIAWEQGGLWESAMCLLRELEHLLCGCSRTPSASTIPSMRVRKGGIGD